MTIQKDLGEEIGYLIQRAVDIEGEKWTSAIMYNVSTKTFERIRNAKHALDKPNL